MISSLSSYSSGSTSTIESLVSQYMAIERQPLETLKTQRDQLDVSAAMFSDLREKIAAVKSAADELAGIDKYAITKVKTVFDSHAVASSDSDVVTATADSDAANGTYTLENIVLAKNHRVQSAELSSSWTASENSTIVINGAKISVAAGATLEDLRQAINNGDYDTDRGVVATIVNVDSTHSRLILSAWHTGTEYQIQATDLAGSILSSLGITTSTGTAVGITNVSTSSENPAYPAANLNDGVTGDANSWHGADTESSWTVTLDLGSAQTVNRLVWGRDQGGTATSGTPKDYKIEYLDDDGVTWKTLKTVTANSLEAGGTQTDTFYGVTTNKLRITVTATSDGAPPAIDEIALYNDVGSFTQPVLQAATDASFTINGVAVSGKQSNTVTDTVTGLTINLYRSNSDSDPVTLTVSSDTKSMQAKIELFLSKLNELTDYIKSKCAVTKSSNSNSYTRGPLSGNTLYTSLQTSLRSDMLSEVSGVINGVFSRLAELGITMDNDMHFKVSDSSKLTKWLTSNTRAVADFFGAEDGIATKISQRLEPYVASSASTSKSYLDSEDDAIENERKSLNERISTLEERLAIKEQNYRTQFTRLQAAIIESQLMQQRIQAMMGSISSFWG